MSKEITPSNNFLLYRNEDGAIKVDVLLKDETIWLTINQMAELFHIDKSGISRILKHLRNRRITTRATLQKLHSSKRGSRQVNRNLEFYNLDMIISVGYRVNSYEEHISEFGQLNNSKAIIKGFVSIMRNLRIQTILLVKTILMSFSSK